MATDAEIVAQLDAAILNVTTKIAAGDAITEYWEGEVKVKKESPAELLKTLRTMRDMYAAAAQTDTEREPGLMYYGGRE